MGVEASFQVLKYELFDYKIVVIVNMLQVLHQDSSVVGAKAVNVKISKS